MEYTDQTLLLYGYAGANFDWPFNLIVSIGLGLMFGFILLRIKYHG